jgi:hypothetical protein
MDKIRQMNTQTTKTDTERIGYKGKTYLIDIPMRDLVEAPHQTNKWQRQQMEHAIARQDWVTVENRITNGLRFMWLHELDDNGNRVP